MSRVCLVTSVANSEAVKWGLELHRIAVPTVLLCSAQMAEAFREHGTSSQVIIATTQLPPPMTVRDKLICLREARHAEYHGAADYYWVNVELIYQHLSFEFLYSDILIRALRQFGAEPTYFAMPGYHAGSFFGGPQRMVEAACELLDEGGESLFESVGTDSSPVPVFRRAFRSHAGDLNLALAGLIENPVLHIVGDSHVYNCFTLNKAIGCRPNVLVNTRDVSEISISYAYQFTHHLGGRTMHHAGRPGALLATAEECGVKDGDAVVWVFGEIDARSHIFRRRREDHRGSDEVIDTLARDYVRSILEVGSKYPGLRNVVFAPIPPLDNPGYASQELPVHGSIEERIAATRQLRAVLKTLCDRHEIMFLDVTEPFETARGDLRWEFSDRFCHIASTYQAPIVEGLYTLLAGMTGDGARGRVRPLPFG